MLEVAPCVADAANAAHDAPAGRNASACICAASVGRIFKARMPPYFSAYISPISRLYLPDISPISPRYLSYISLISRPYLAYISHLQGDDARVLGGGRGARPGGHDRG